MLAELTPINKVSIVALGKKISDQESIASIAELARKLDVSLMSESRNRKELLSTLLAQPVVQSEPEIPAYIRTIVAELINESGAMSGNTKRASYKPWFKSLIAEIKQKYSVRHKDLSELLNISEETLMGFRASLPAIQHAKMDDLSLSIATIWNEAPPQHKKTLDAFWSYVGKNHQQLQVAYGGLRQILIDLGLYSPRGPKIKNHGGVKTSLDWHAIWEGDGKQVNITINQHRHSFCWYSFVDQGLTLIVGSNIAKTETAENFLKALKDSKDKTGVYSIGILIDNRLSDIDMSPINRFFYEHNIKLIRTFPGNSKSNGTIENNFSIFEKFVGDINIKGRNEEEIAASIAESMVEVFTQLRNHQPRQRLGGKTPAEAAQDAKRPEHQRSMVEKIALRLNKETFSIEQKWDMIAGARVHFEPLSEAAEDKIKRQLKHYSMLTLIDSEAAYLAKIANADGNRYTSAYFMAILRNKQETKAKLIYNEAYRAGIEKAALIMPASLLSETHCAQIFVDEIKNAQNMPSPSQVLLHLEAISWALVRYSESSSLTSLWQGIKDLAAKSFAISLHFWQQVNAYLTERLGFLLYRDFLSHADHLRNLSEM